MSIELIKNFAPIPDLMGFKRILFVGPHPDDIEISSGGYVKKMIEAKVEVAFLIVTDGGAAANDPNLSIDEIKKVRKQEAINGANYLGVRDVEVLDIPDGGIYKVEDMVVAIAKKVIAFKPDAVFGPDPLLPMEIHPDHINCGKAVGEALIVSKFRYVAFRHGINVKKDQELPRGISLVYYYSHRPNAYVSINKDQFLAKMESILCHKSQIDQSFMLMRRYLEVKAINYGEKIDSEYAEAFFAMSPVHQHCFTEEI